MIILIFFISVATEDLKDAYGHVIRTGELKFKGNYLKRIRSHSKNHKQFKVIMTTVVFEPSDIYDTHVNIDENLQIDINIYNTLLLKANNRTC